MTTFMTDLDADLLSLLDFEYAPPCEAADPDGTNGCDKTAEWKLIVSCCGAVWLLCEEHKELNVNVIAREMVVDCRSCGKSVPGSEIVFAIDRI
jgi:hypothetical protein